MHIAFTDRKQHIKSLPFENDLKLWGVGKKTTETHKKKHMFHLVVGFQPNWKIICQNWIISPKNSGWKLKIIWVATT